MTQHTIQALGGSDCRREAVTMSVELASGGDLLTDQGTRLRFEGASVLMGWGDLDGDAVVFETGSTGWDCTIPLAELERIGWESPDKEGGR